MSRKFDEELVRPILDARYPGLPHSAGLLGRGSEVLGFDDEMSTDHDWKPRVLLYLREDERARWPVGPVDQFCDLLWPARNRRALLRIFDHDE